MAVVAALGVFVGIVILLSMLGARRTRGRGCCAPADPADDARMRYPRSQDVLESTDPPAPVDPSRRP